MAGRQLIINVPPDRPFADPVTPQIGNVTTMLFIPPPDNPLVTDDGSLFVTNDGSFVVWM